MEKWKAVERGGAKRAEILRRRRSFAHERGEPARGGQSGLEAAPGEGRGALLFDVPGRAGGCGPPPAGAGSAAEGDAAPQASPRGTRRQVQQLRRPAAFWSAPRSADRLASAGTQRYAAANRSLAPPAPGKRTVYSKRCGRRGEPQFWAADGGGAPAFSEAVRRGAAASEGERARVEEAPEQAARLLRTARRGAAGLYFEGRCAIIGGRGGGRWRD